MQRHRSTYIRRIKRKAKKELVQLDDDYDGDTSSSESDSLASTSPTPKVCAALLDVSIPTDQEISIVEDVVDTSLSETGPEEFINPGPVFSCKEGDSSFSSFEDVSDSDYFWVQSDPDSDSDTCSVYFDCSTPDSISPLPALDFQAGLRKWAIECNIPKTSLRKLLLLLKPIRPSLPLHPDTLLETKPLSGVEKMGQGLYYNFGLHHVLEQVLKYDSTLMHLALSVNFDGLPIFKSSTCECWPIFILVDGLRLPPLMAAVWCGTKGKPPINDYLKDFVAEMKDLLANGIVFKDVQRKVTLTKFVCDAPATAFVKGTVGHGGYYGCGKCTAVGTWKGRMTFPTRVAPLRTDNAFVVQDQPEHHLQTSPLVELGVGLVTSFPLDYLHLVCLGVVKRLLIWMIFGKKNVRRRVISDSQLDDIDIRLLSANKFWPRDFSRKPRSLREIKRWKATEFRQFILYLSVSVLHGSVLSKPYYDLFIHLHIAMTILSSNNINNSTLQVAETILQVFVLKACSLMGKEFCSYNVHNLLHLSSDCSRFGKLDNFSSFPFENELQIIKAAIRGKTKPLHQLVARYLERKKELLLAPRKALLTDGVVPSTASKGGPQLKMSGQTYQKLNLNNRVISILQGDGVLILKNGNLVICRNFITSKNETYVIGHEFLEYSEMYDKPLKSSLLGIYLAGKVSPHLRKWPISEVRSKAVAVPFKNGHSYTVFPLED